MSRDPFSFNLRCVVLCAEQGDSKLVFCDGSSVALIDVALSAEFEDGAWRVL
jgi:hypothetical protein